MKCHNAFQSICLLVYMVFKKKGRLKYYELLSYGSDRLFIIQNTNSYIVYLLFIVAPIVLLVLCRGSCFFCAVLCILSSFLDYFSSNERRDILCDCDISLLRGYKTFFHAQLSTKFILLINVKMPTLIGILTLISMINTKFKRFKGRKLLNCRYFIFYEQ